MRSSFRSRNLRVCLCFIVTCICIEVIVLPSTASSGTFISSSEDSTGTLGDIENKIARATMIPRDHGEVYFVNMIV